MGYYEVAALIRGFDDDIGGEVDAYQRACARMKHRSNLKAGVVEILLISGRKNLLDGVDYIFY